MATLSQWYFTADEVVSTPSIVEGVPPSEERLRRAKGVNFIYQAGVMLDLPQITLWVAGVFFHRFFMRYSMVQEKGGIHHYVSHSCGRWPVWDIVCVLARRQDHCANMYASLEHCGDRAVLGKQGRRELQKDQGHYHSRCQGGPKECQTHY
jgi:hypothetical protein